MNLIPQHYRDEYRYERMTSFVIYAGTVWLIVAVAWAVLLLPSYFFLSSQLEVITANNQETSDVRTREIERLSKEISEVNTVLSTVHNLSSDHTSVIDIMREITERTGGGIRYSSMNIAKGSGATISLQGVAKTRKDLQALKVDMEASPMFAAAEIPVETFNHTVDIAFSLTLTLK